MDIVNTCILRNKGKITFMSYDEYKIASNRIKNSRYKGKEKWNDKMDGAILEMKSYNGGDIIYSEVYYLNVEEYKFLRFFLKLV
jgi:hypothetical protein